MTESRNYNLVARDDSNNGRERDQTRSNEFIGCEPYMENNRKRLFSSSFLWLISPIKTRTVGFNQPAIITNY